jgi:hypothetical protein
MGESEEDVRRRIAESVWADIEGKPDSLLVYEAGEGRGQEPAGRPRAQAALSVRLRRSIDLLRAETAKSSKQMVCLTWALVVLTVAVVVMTAVLVWKGW